MRLLKLSLTGFRSYSTPVTVEFTGKSLVAALGDTGAGKSSLLDAITFALFRKSSWDAKEPRQLIADGAQAMSVELNFLHDDQRWHVHRTMHVTNPNAARHFLKNLDTGDEYDNASKVDTRIKTLLQMGYDTFLRVGLLPQGKFDQLLTAATKERTARLRELFGAESLDTVQQLATRHCLTLKGLIGDAKTKRAAMPENPQQAAAVAGEIADAADARAGYLNTAIDRITALQTETAQARNAATAADAAAQNLSTRAVTDADTVLNKVEPIAVGIVTRRDALRRRAIEAAHTEEELRKAIAVADNNGEGLSALGRAAVTLETLAARAEEQRGERDRLAALNERLDADGTAIATAEAELATRADDTRPLTEAASNAAEASNRIRTRAITVRSLVTAAVTAARHVADAVSARAIAVGDCESARESVVPLKSEALAAEGRVRDAETRLETLRLRYKAAGIAAELHPGDDCPVCRQALPAGFTAESETGAAELRRVKAQLRDVRVAYDKASSLLTDARAAVTAAERAVAESGKNCQDAEQKAREAQGTAASAFTDFAALAADAEEHFDVGSATATLTEATTALATPDTDGADHPERYTTTINEAITACERAAAAIADQKRTEALSHTTRLEAEREILESRKGSHRRGLDDAVAASDRYTRAVARLAAEVRALPIRIQAMLPEEAINIGADAAATAASAVAARTTEIQKLIDALEAARSEKTAVLVQQRTLDQESRTAVDQPVYKLRTALDDWARAATQAIAHLGETGQHEVPQAPASSGIAEIRSFAAALSEIAATLDSKLNETSAASAARAKTTLSRLRQHAAELTDVDGFDPTADLTAPQMLHPLVAAAAKAAKEAEDQHKQQHMAQDLIKPAADLHTAITAGEARLEALDALRRELVDAKFLGRLTMLRTRALLGVASDLLGQLTDERFGFADDFDIVSRSSCVVHHPNRLSGGEKFLASLALALALAELHSRSGPRLGSLFLDEGFAALDTAALESALEVLRTQAGGDRLVMVISHLHAVAEAVDDVLWVEHGHTGSTARWLTAAERDELVQADLANGLQALA
ncbi:SMC family ATPase [Actinomadura sp. DC4]|uniref:AAA family ATPase n=1 Tax=Actinomadura sp. DC4 TaxID=3055069 RepID=UPI0025B0CEEA|nr:SMC family ATPase [Actinomadura sp. DC4]MDN3356839.1 SMC family ATPase [Actinomadura sp. DC4]